MEVRQVLVKILLMKLILTIPLLVLERIIDMDPQNKEVLKTLENLKIYRTDQDGSIMFKIKNNKLKIETCLP